MRIRKCALKLLGSTIAYFSPPPPPQQQQQPCSSPAWDSQAASAAAAGILCQLNRSPWDLIPNEQNAISQEGEDADPTDDDDIKAERKPLEPPHIKSGVKIKVGLEEEEEKKVKKKAKRKRMEKGIDSTVATKTGKTATPSCKKSDGKGWNCKRPAHLPHSLCQYHLTQLRSYTHNNSHRKAADQATGGGDKHRKKRRVDTAGYGNDFYYYYYSGFGPWRGIRRGSSNGSDNLGNVTEGEGRENTESVNGHDADLEDNEQEDDGKGCCNEENESDDDDDDDDDEEEEEEEKRNCRKRGRKPVKARSLKSLL